MRARNLLERYGRSLIGQTVLTERYGEWPGGSAEIIQIKPAKDASEIVFQVRHKTATDPLDLNSYWEIGVYEHENVELFAADGSASDAVTESVKRKLTIRAERGLSKYGVSMERNDLTELQWLQHAQDELLDGAVYLEKLIQGKKP